VTRALLYEIFGYVAHGYRSTGNDVEEPEKSRIFSRDREFLHDQTVRPFICDSLRMLLIGVTTPPQPDHLTELDIDVQRRGPHESRGH
jgi:chemotaxis protein MotA